MWGEIAPPTAPKVKVVPWVCSSGSVVLGLWFRLVVSALWVAVAASGAQGGGAIGNVVSKEPL